MAANAVGPAGPEKAGARPAERRKARFTPGMAERRRTGVRSGGTLRGSPCRAYRGQSGRTSRLCVELITMPAAVYQASRPVTMPR